MNDEPCRVCGRATGPRVVVSRADVRVCHRCRHRMAEWLALLPTLSERLRYALVPTGGGTGERVTAPQGEAPLPARLSALTLLAAGSDDARCVFVPAVRVWATVERVPAAAADTPRSVLIWHREPLHDDNGYPVMAPVDDQTGVLPVHVWLREWALEWRTRLGGEAPVRRNPLDDPDRDPARHDPLAEEWDQRFPADAWSRATRAHHGYLTTWLGYACAEHPHIAEFAASLRTLTGTIRAALGDVEDLEYLGRCPEDITEAGIVAFCGAALWHDPYASVIVCPRCRTETGERQRVWLARRILDAWPIDRRRRYTRELIDALRPVECVACHTPVAVEWLEATERADTVRFWRPGAIACPNGCALVE